jgi:hypothetical protein
LVAVAVVIEIQVEQTVLMVVPEEEVVVMEEERIVFLVMGHLVKETMVEQEKQLEFMLIFMEAVVVELMQRDPLVQVVMVLQVV